jgi:hypothetical protein
MVLSFSWRGPRPSSEDDVLAANTGYLRSFLCRQGPRSPKQKGRIALTLITEPTRADKWAAQRGEGPTELASG